MSLSNLYVDAFLTKKPKEGINIVQGRLKDSMTLDTELAEYFKERAQIEENYAKCLSKASKRLYMMDPGVLGHFAPIWDLLLKEYNQIANYHSEMAYKITQQIEEPLRSSNSDDRQRLEQMEPLIHSFETKNKLSSVKGSIFKKSSTKSPNWEIEGVEYLNLTQKIDEARLNRLKNSVELFEKIQSDQLKKRIELSNKTLSATENFDIQHDIQDFCLERGKGLTTIALSQTRQNSHDSQRSTTSSTNKFKSVFMKKKKQHNILNDNDNLPQTYSTIDDQSHFNSTALDLKEDTIHTATIMKEEFNNSTHLIDSEGYSIPATTGQFPIIASDISSRDTSDDMDSDFQSLKLNQKLQINIKDSALKEEAAETNESFTKIASMLRERTPTMARKPRGRRESSMLRSQTDSSIYNTYNDQTNNINRRNSMLSMSSMDTGHYNPFLQQQSYSPTSNNLIPNNNSPQLSQHPTFNLVDSPAINRNNNWQLHPIIEDQNPELSISIHEKTNMIDENYILRVLGQVTLTYTGPTNTPILLNISQLNEIQQLMHNPQYITDANDHYILNTIDFPQGQPTVCFTYQVDLNTDSRLPLPIQLTPSWKCINGISYLMIKHSKNQEVDTVKGSVHVLCENVTSVQSTPQGTWDTNKNRLTWDIKDLYDQYEDQQDGPPRLLAKFFTREGETGTSQPIYINYLAKDTLVTGLTLDVLDNKRIKQYLETTVQIENFMIF